MSILEKQIIAACAIIMAIPALTRIGILMWNLFIDLVVWIIEWLERYLERRKR